MKNLPKINKPALSLAEFAGLASVLPHAEWCKNLGTPQTTRACKRDIGVFTQIRSVNNAEEMCLRARTHIITWRDNHKSRELAGSIIHHKLLPIHH